MLRVDSATFSLVGSARRSIMTATKGSQRVGGRDECWTGLGLDWMQIIANFVEFWWDLNCKTLQNLGSDPDLDLVNRKEMPHVCCAKAAFSKYFGPYLDFTFEKNFGLCLDLDWVLKNQDWIWVAKYDSFLISDRWLESTTEGRLELVKWRSNVATWLPEVSMDRIRIGYPVGRGDFSFSEP